MENYYHRMDRRSKHKRYGLPGTYHVTIKVNMVYRQALGRVVGDINAADGSPQAPQVELNEAGRMVEQELTTSITAHYPMIEIQDHVVMPDHLHCIVVVHRDIISKNGVATHLGQVIAGFKKGCNRRFWEMLDLRGKPASTGDNRKPASTGENRKPASTGENRNEASTGENRKATNAGEKSNEASTGENRKATNAGEKSNEASTGDNRKATNAGEKSNEASMGAGSSQTNTGENRNEASMGAGSSQTNTGGVGSQCFAVYPQGYKVPSRGTTGRAPLFSLGFVDVIPLSAEQLETQRHYIHNNPRSRLLRNSHRLWLQCQRKSIDTHLSPRALKSYLQQECSPAQFNEEIWQRIEKLLIVKDGHVYCDSYGNCEMLNCPILPVVCHRKDTLLHSLQLQRCMEKAAEETVLVSARIAKGEQRIMDDVIAQSYPVTLIADNGFPDIYHPSEVRIQMCAEGHLLLVSPWQYHYRGADEMITVAECKTMNCIAQAICKTRDSWWK